MSPCKMDETKPVFVQLEPPMKNLLRPIVSARENLIDLQPKIGIVE